MQAALRALELPLAECQQQLADAILATLRTAAGAGATPSGAGAMMDMDRAPSLGTAVRGLHIASLGSTALPAGGRVAGGGRLIGPGGAAVRYIGVFGFDEAQLREAAVEALQQQAAAEPGTASPTRPAQPGDDAAPASDTDATAAPGTALLPAGVPKLRDGPLHVTLWHAQDGRVKGPGSGAGVDGGAADVVQAHGSLGEALLARVNDPVELHVVALYCSPQVRPTQASLHAHARPYGLQPSREMAVPHAPRCHITQ